MANERTGTPACCDCIAINSSRGHQMATPAACWMASCVEPRPIERARSNELASLISTQRSWFADARASERQEQAASSQRAYQAAFPTWDNGATMVAPLAKNRMAYAALGALNEV